FVLRALMSCACCADLRVVHSLPTRRSSDLNGGHAGSGWPPSPIIGSPRRRGAARLAALAHVLCELGQMPPFGESRPAARRDRCLSVHADAADPPGIATQAALAGRARCEGIAWHGRPG